MFAYSLRNTVMSVLIKVLNVLKTQMWIEKVFFLRVQLNRVKLLSNYLSG